MSPEYSKILQNDRAAKLLEAMLQGTIAEIKPQLNPQSELGFSFPTLSQLLNIADKEIRAILESLADEGILKRKFVDKFLRCPQCGSMNIRPVYRCSKCHSGNIIHGRVLEHLLCKFVGTEDEFFLKGRLICPQCKQELQTLGSDYRSLGILYKCRDCTEVFNQPTINWSCFKCSSIADGNKIVEVDAHSYSLNEERRNRLQFELRPKIQLLQFLQGREYEVKENATVKGESGATHIFDLLATRDDGVVVHNLAIGVEIANKPIELDRVFNFDDKAYDAGLFDKLLIAIPELTPEASKFAARQRIKTLESVDLDAFLSSSITPGPSQEVKPERKPFQFKSRSAMVSHLQDIGYEIRANAKVKGRSGANHIIDILAIKDDGIVVYNVAIGIEVADKPIEIEKVFDFDDKSYDSGFLDKVLIAIPGLTRESSQFAQRQRIKVFQAQMLEPSE